MATYTSIVLFVFAHVLSPKYITLNAEQSGASLSPETWSSKELERLEEFILRKEKNFRRPLLYSECGLVAGTDDARAVHAGAKTLEKGGNAMDACIATALTDVVLSTGSTISFAGVANILYYNRRTGKTSNIDASWRLPNLRTTEDVPTLETLGDSVLVPGLIAGVSEATEMSKFPLAKLIEPALYFAERGAKVSHALGKMIKAFYGKTLNKTKQGRTTFTNPATNKPYKAGETIHQPHLARFLRRLSVEGKGYFYRGDWAEKLVETVQKHGGALNINDMAEYQADFPEPAVADYSGHRIVTTSVENNENELRERVNALEIAKFWETNDTYLTNATKLTKLAAISRFTKFISWYYENGEEAERIISEYFNLDASPRYRGSKSEARSFWQGVSETEALLGANEKIWELLTVTPDATDNKYRHSASGIVAVDSQGNICSMSHSANSRPWGTGLFVEGVALPHSGATFPDVVQRKRFGTRVPSGLQPVIVFKKIFKRKSKTTVLTTVKPKTESLEMIDVPILSRLGVVNRREGKGLNEMPGLIANRRKLSLTKRREGRRLNEMPGLKANRRKKSVTKKAEIVRRLSYRMEKHRSRVDLASDLNKRRKARSEPRLYNPSSGRTMYSKAQVQQRTHWKSRSNMQSTRSATGRNSSKFKFGKQKVRMMEGRRRHLKRFHWMVQKNNNKRLSKINVEVRNVQENVPKNFQEKITGNVEANVPGKEQDKGGEKNSPTERQSSNHDKIANMFIRGVPINADPVTTPKSIAKSMRTKVMDRDAIKQILTEAASSTITTPTITQNTGRRYHRKNIKTPWGILKQKFNPTAIATIGPTPNTQRTKERKKDVNSYQARKTSLWDELTLKPTTDRVITALGVARVLTQSTTPPRREKQRYQKKTAAPTSPTARDRKLLGVARVLKQSTTPPRREMQRYQKQTAAPTSPTARDRKLLGVARVLTQSTTSPRREKQRYQKQTAAPTSPTARDIKILDGMDPEIQKIIENKININMVNGEDLEANSKSNVSLDLGNEDLGNAEEIDERFKVPWRVPSEDADGDLLETDDSPEVHIYGIDNEKNLKGPEWFKSYIREILSKEEKKDDRERRQLRKKSFVLEPVAAFAVSGQSIAETTLQYLTNVLDSGMNPKQVLEMPLLYDSSPDSHRQDVRVEKFSFDQGVLAKARKQGQKVTEVSFRVVREVGTRGAVIVIKGSRVYGSSDGYAEGYQQDQEKDVEEQGDS
ncbi:predicted protein [Nematostella vectensis]|uniref:Gamma-glutamyltransferase n=1 Tax=Nematostella vectensis TaxID=45351 RepID=A7RPA1_NEMVE|nr:predicted protein [Nematostella vectensis]|eukprot:XP_001638768.1 predicted protein [Nematostella vectensis]